MWQIIAVQFHTYLFVESLPKNNSDGLVSSFHIILVWNWFPCLYQIKCNYKSNYLVPSDGRFRFSSNKADQCSAGALSNYQFSLESLCETGSFRNVKFYTDCLWCFCHCGFNIIIKNQYDFQCIHILGLFLISSHPSIQYCSFIVFFYFYN